MSVEELKQRMGSVEELERKVLELEEMMWNLNQARENEMDEPDEEEPGIALEDQLRIAEQSAKAIELLSSHLLFTVWQTCSKNTYGNDV